MEGRKTGNDSIDRRILFFGLLMFGLGGKLGSSNHPFLRIDRDVSRVAWPADGFISVQKHGADENSFRLTVNERRYRYFHGVSSRKSYIVPYILLVGPCKLYLERGHS